MTTDRGPLVVDILCEREARKVRVWFDYDPGTDCAPEVIGGEVMTMAQAIEEIDHFMDEMDERVTIEYLRRLGMI